MGGHYLRENRSVWSPRHVAFLDTETYPEGRGDAELLRLRLWVAGAVDRRSTGGAKTAVDTACGFTRGSLARWVGQAAVGKSSLWLFAHNLGFDLTTSALPEHLHRLGWKMSEWNFVSRNVTGRMCKGSKTLTLVDSGSWLPWMLERIGREVGRPKLSMPEWDAPEEEWISYCTGDVLVLAEAVLTLLDWWDRCELGHWAKTGPGTGWNSWRHKAPPYRFLVKDDDAGRRDDRLAVYGGRRDVTRVGRIEGGPFALVDFADSYLTLAASQLLPKGRLVRYDSFEPDSVWVEGNRFGVVAECEVETPAPLYPLRTSGGVFYPVGRFRTVLASPEIVSARDMGHLRSVGAGWVHDVGYPLADWAAWALETVHAGADDIPPVVRLMVKQWGRSVIGKFAGHQSRRTDRGPARWPGWHLERGTTGEGHKQAAEVHIAGRCWWYQMDQEGENSYPAVLAFVESYLRVALGRALDALGEDLWVCCDTDGVLIDLTEARRWLRERGAGLGRVKSPLRVAEAVCEQLEAFTGPLVPHVKALSETLQVTGPQHYSGDSFEVSSGRPGRPERDGDGRLRWWTWPKAAWQMEHGDSGGYVRVETSWTEPAAIAHRWVLADGRCVPPAAGIAGDGSSRLLGWGEAPGADGLSLAALDQCPALRKLL